MSGSPAYVETRAQAQVVSADGPRPFVTHVRYRLADGRLLDRASRRHRKRPGALGRWIAVLFMVGSACFVAGSMAGYSTLVGARADAVTSLNMLGSIFFGISPIAGWVQPSTGDLLDAALDTSGTFWGAVCFFAGAALLLRADAAPTPRRPR